jgi:hypothetical protein
MAAHDKYIPRGILHDAWWMSSDVVIRFPSKAWRSGLVRSRPPRIPPDSGKSWKSRDELANLPNSKARSRRP